MHVRLQSLRALLIVAAALTGSAPAHAQAVVPQVAEKAAPRVAARATLFPLAAVRLLPGPFQAAQETDRAYLRRLDPDRLLSWMRKNAGLAPKAPPYGGWDRDGSGTIGHYLSACAQMTQATGDPVLQKRVDYVVSELAACQKAGGDGGLYAFGWDRTVYFPRMAQGDLIKTDVTAWYGTHKTMAGLRDAYALCGNGQARAVLLNLCDWAVRVTAKLTPAQWQTMLSGEHGGPQEVLADAYAFTGDRRYLDCAEKFRHAAVFDPLAKNDPSVLAGLHANTQIPKFVGYERIYELTGDKAYGDAARSFWDAVTTEYSWANGGNSQWERFFAPTDYEKQMQEVCGPETCNTYNLLKLTQQLYALAPSAHYLDYYERALYNHILPSEAPGGGFVYYTPMRPGHYRVFSRDYDAFWCCVGTGMENHAKYGQMIYAAAPHRLYVNLFLPSTLTDHAQGLTLRQETRFPEEPKTRLTLTLAQPRQMTLSLRVPAWAAPGAVRVRVNGTPVAAAARPGSYLDIPRLWKTSDRVEMALPMLLTTEPLPGSKDYAAFFYGPVLLAGKLGTQGLIPADFHGGGPISDPIGVSGQVARKKLPAREEPAILATPAEAVQKLIPVPGHPLTFRTLGLVRPGDVTLVPFYTLFFERYALYWSFTTPAAYAAKQTRFDQEARDAQVLETRTVDHVLVGEAASEAAHALTFDRSRSGGAQPPFTHWRDADGFFAYTVKVLPDHPLSLRCAYWGSDAGRTFDILVDGQTVATQTLTGTRPGDYLYAAYPLPAALTRGKSTVTVRFQPRATGPAGGLFDLRVLHL